MPAATMISAEEAKELTEEACKVAASGEPTKTQLRLARLAKLADGIKFPGSLPTGDLALAAKRYFDSCPGDNDSEFDDVLTNIAGNKAVAKATEEIITRLVAMGIAKMAQVNEELIIETMTDEESKLFGFAGATAVADAIGTLVELRSPS